MRVLQANLQHAIAAMAVLVRTLTHPAFTIALIQEPYTGSDGNIRGISGFRGSVFASEPCERPRTCVLTQGIAAQVLPQFLSRDLVAVTMHISGRKTVFASAYFPHTSEAPPVEVTQLVQYCQKENLLLLIGCDANAHNVTWGSSGDNQRGTDLLEWMCEHNLIVLNRGNSPTFCTAARQEVLDVTMCCAKTEKLVDAWHVSQEESLSDHKHILFDVTIGTDVKRDERIRNPRATNWSQYERELEKSLPRDTTPLSNVVEIERYCNEITGAIMKAYEKSCSLKTRQVRTNTPWWNKEIEKL